MFQTIILMVTFLIHCLSLKTPRSIDRNINLCGPPLARACPFTVPTPQPTPQPTASPENKSKKLPTGAIVGIAIGSPLLFLILLSCLRKDINMKPQNTQAPIRPQTSSSSKDEGERGNFKMGFIVLKWRICCGHLLRFWGKEGSGVDEGRIGCGCEEIERCCGDKK